jgi:DNA gyrase subunit B
LNFKENNWSTILENEEIIFSKKENKVTETFTIRLSDFNNFNYVNLKKYSELMQENFLSKSFLKLGDQTIEILSPKDLIKKALDQSKKNYSVQRYKGLGEMNPDQLWQTTLDPEYRSILRVDIDDAQRADDIFEELMGDDVEKRKVFIQSNAKKVSNLDV